jgi:hypothetical protein
VPSLTGLVVVCGAKRLGIDNALARIPDLCDEVERLRKERALASAITDDERAAQAQVMREDLGFPEGITDAREIVRLCHVESDEDDND